ncbi:MAG: hypothetical protein HKP10_05675 [Kiritimatiellales bacterium]|nr:hypothetical protein [Kiritimatiellales bacterium]
MKKYELNNFAFICIAALLFTGSAIADDLSDALMELEINVKNVQGSAEVAGAAGQGDTEKLKGTIIKRDVLDAAKDEFSNAKNANNPKGMKAASDKADKALKQSFASAGKGPAGRRNTGDAPGDFYDPVFMDDMPWKTGLQRIVNKKEWANFWKAGKSGNDRFGGGRFGDRDATPE